MLYLGYRRTSMSARLGSRQHVRPILNFCPCKHQQVCCRTLIDCVVQHKVSCPVQAFSTPGPSHKFTGITRMSKVVMPGDRGGHSAAPYRQIQRRNKSVANKNPGAWSPWRPKFYGCVYYLWVFSMHHVTLLVSGIVRCFCTPEPHFEVVVYP